MTEFPFAIVGFDLDGTLCDTAWDLGIALNRTMELLGRPAFALDEVRRFIGGGTGQMLRGALAETGGFDPAELPALQERLFGFYAEALAVHSRLYPGGEAMLDALAARGVHIAVATNKREAFAVQLLDELGLSPRFATVIGGDTLGPGKAKPAPDMLHEMVRRGVRRRHDLRCRRGARGRAAGGGGQLRLQRPAAASAGRRCGDRPFRRAGARAAPARIDLTDFPGSPAGGQAEPYPAACSSRARSPRSSRLSHFVARGSFRVARHAACPGTSASTAGWI